MIRYHALFQNCQFEGRLNNGDHENIWPTYTFLTTLEKLQ